MAAVVNAAPATARCCSAAGPRGAAPSTMTIRRATASWPAGRGRLVAVSAVGDVAAEGNTYLIAGAVAVALVGTAFPILFSRKDTYVIKQSNLSIIYTILASLNSIPNSICMQVPGVRRRRVHPQGGREAAGERGEEGPGPDRMPQLQRTRQARTDRQVANPIHTQHHPCMHAC